MEKIEEVFAMKLLLIMLSSIILSGLLVGCGPAVGRATGADAESTGSGPSATITEVDDTLILVNENLASQEALLVGQEQTLGKQQAEIQNLKEIVTAFESNTGGVETSVENDIAAVAANVSEMANQFENDIAVHGQYLEQDISMLSNRVAALEDQSAFIQNILFDLQNQAETIQYSVSEISAEVEQSGQSVDQFMGSFSQEFQGQLIDLQDQAAYLNVAVETSSEVIQALDNAIKDVEDVQEELAGASNYPVTVEQFVTYDNLINDGLIGDEINSMPAPETMIVPDCTGADGTRECIDKLSSAITVDVDGTYESMQLSVTDLCQAAEIAYGLERVHGNRWDESAPSDETDALLDAGFISNTEFNVVQWTLKNKEILEDAYTGC
tara:strand:+ start:636 stop:1784 length:1149 start_codon:yes stop_codon:yes gene_type:complete